MNIFKEHVKYNTEVYSLDHGDGEIINYLNLYDGLDDYFEVKYKKNGDSVLYSTKSYDRIRIESSLSVLSEERDFQKFPKEKGEKEEKKGQKKRKLLSKWIRILRTHRITRKVKIEELGEKQIIEGDK